MAVGQTQFLLTAMNPEGHPTQDEDAASHQELAGHETHCLSVLFQKLGSAQATHLLLAVR